MNNLVSIVIPVYDASLTLIETLQSVIDQTYANYEIILINDGSKDNSLEVAKKFAENHKEKKIEIFSQKNKGVSVARNVGLKNAKGDFIALLDSDDVWAPTKLEEQMDIMLKNPSLGLLSTNRNGESIKFFLLRKFKRIEPISIRMMIIKNFFITPTVIFRKEVIQKVGYFDENMRYAEDINFFIRIAEFYPAFLLNKSLVITGRGKPNFGHSGLSSNLRGIFRGELVNIKMVRRKKLVGSIEGRLLKYFLIAKYFRRILLVKLNTWN